MDEVRMKLGADDVWMTMLAFIGFLFEWGCPLKRKPGIVAHHFRLLAPLAPHPKREEPSLVAPFK